MGTTLSQRLSSALQAATLSPATLAKKADTTEATISNWLNDKVQADHVKASLLLKISSVLGVRPGWLLLDDGPRSESVTDSVAASHALKPETLTLTFQLVGEALEGRELSLPPEKRAELAMLIYDLLEEGMPEAKVLRFASRAAAA
jgi:transcriptional regulator with XRE-family HTH domain